MRKLNRSLQGAFAERTTLKFFNFRVSRSDSLLHLRQQQSRAANQTSHERFTTRMEPEENGHTPMRNHKGGGP